MIFNKLKKTTGCISSERHSKTTYYKLYYSSSSDIKNHLMITTLEKKIVFYNIGPSTTNQDWYS